MSWWNLLEPVSNVVNKWQDNRMKISDAKLGLKLAKITAETEKAKSVAKVEADWDMEALKQSKSSWKDEWLLFIFTMPLVGIFIPGIQEHIAAGFSWLDTQVPVWFHVYLGGMIAQAFGLRWLMSNSKLKSIKDKLETNTKQKI